MAVTRKQVTDFIVENIALVIPGDDYNAKLTRERLERMTDDEFDKYIRSLARPKTEEDKQHQEILPFYAPNFNEAKLTLDNLMAVAEKIGIPLFEQLWITDPQTGRVYLTPNAYPVFDLLVRRQAQMLTKKSSIPEDSRHVDEMSGQVTGKSKGSKISFPELQAQLAKDQTATLLEEIKVRGGDETALREMDRQLIEHGEVNLSDVTVDGQVSKSTSMVSILLRGALLENNIDEV